MTTTPGLTICLSGGRGEVDLPYESVLELIDRLNATGKDASKALAVRLLKQLDEARTGCPA